MRWELVILGVAVVGLALAGLPWLALLLAFGGALAIMAASPRSGSQKREWSDLPPVPEAGSYPGWDFWVKHIEGATKTIMDTLRTFTGIHYAVDEWGGIIKKKVWDADIPTELRWNPYVGPYWAHKKTSDAIIVQMYQRILMLQQAYINEKDPKRREEIKRELEELVKKYNEYIKDNKLD